jgi:ribosomal protein S18 acetylase RimI-like enzyme
MSCGVYIERLEKVSEKDIEDYYLILNQLTNIPKLPADYLSKLIRHPGIILLVARNTEHRIVGILTLASYFIPEGFQKGWIEDVVVDQNYRGQGIGENLVKKALDLAEENVIKTVNLTSRPKRVEANGLYQKLGFKKIETNFYRYEVK